MGANFIPPIPIGQFKPSSEAIASWLYEIWKYLQENPIPDAGDISGDAEQVTSEYVTANVPPMIATAISALSYAGFVSGTTLPIYRAANDEISNQDLIEAWDEGCRFALVDDENVYVMIRNDNTVSLLQILTEQQAEGVVSVNGQSGVVALTTTDIPNRSNVSGTSATSALNALKTAIDNMLLTVYPVGAYYASKNSTSPATLFGGTWTAVTSGDAVIVDSGTSGIWTYKKWSDGTAECWGTAQYIASSWTAWGNIYEAQPGIYEDYPLNLFIESPHFMATPATTSNPLMGLEIYTGATAARTPTIYALRPSDSTLSTEAYCRVAMRATGKWTNSNSDMELLHIWKRTE